MADPDFSEFQVTLLRALHGAAGMPLARVAGALNAACGTAFTEEQVRGGLHRQGLAPGAGEGEAAGVAAAARVGGGAGQGVAAGASPGAGAPARASASAGGAEAEVAGAGDAAAAQRGAGAAGAGGAEVEGAAAGARSGGAASPSASTRRGAAARGARARGAEAGEAAPDAAAEALGGPAVWPADLRPSGLGTAEMLGRYTALAELALVKSALVIAATRDVREISAGVTAVKSSLAIYRLAQGLDEAGGRAGGEAGQPAYDLNFANVPMPLADGSGFVGGWPPAGARFAGLEAELETATRELDAATAARFADRGSRSGALHRPRADDDDDSDNDSA